MLASRGSALNLGICHYSRGCGSGYADDDKHASLLFFRHGKGPDRKVRTGLVLLN